MQLDSWITQSNEYIEPWGDTGYGFPRFDLEVDSSGQNGSLRRVNNPAEISGAFEELTMNSSITDMVVDLIGPNVKFHHGKINIKLPLSKSRVGLHQDFSYTPHTNDDIVTTLLLLDDMNLENGALQAIPGSHLGNQVTLWKDDVFIGQTSDDYAHSVSKILQPITGRAGDVCLMHTSTVHSSDANQSVKRRSLLISVYAAADAFMLCPSPLPNSFENCIVAGKELRTARLNKTLIDLPGQKHKGSFFNLPGQGTNTFNNKKN